MLQASSTRCECTAWRLPAWGRCCTPSRSGQRTASPLSSSPPPQSTCCWPTAGLPSSYTCMHLVILSSIGAFTHAFICVCMLSCFLSCTCSFFFFNPGFISCFAIQLFDTCLLQISEQSSEAPSLVLRVALQTNLVNASILITASKPVDVSCGKAFSKLFT